MAYCSMIPPNTKEPCCNIYDYPIINLSPIIGEVSDSAFIGTKLSFKVGELEINMFHLKERPEWFKDGVTVEVDFVHNCITLQ